MTLMKALLRLWLPHRNKELNDREIKSKVLVTFLGTEKFLLGPKASCLSELRKLWPCREGRWSHLSVVVKLHLVWSCSWGLPWNLILYPLPLMPLGRLNSLQSLPKVRPETLHWAMVFKLGMGRYYKGYLIGVILRTSFSNSQLTCVPPFDNRSAWEPVRWGWDFSFPNFPFHDRPSSTSQKKHSPLPHP